jgi:hypothetical protein
MSNGAIHPSKARTWLDIHALRPLDTVLTRADQKAAIATTKLSGGEFSHASFVVDPLMWFDAQPEGCGYHFLTGSIVTHDSDFLDVSNYRHILVLRHPIVALLSPERQAQLAHAAERMCQRLIGRRYARYEHLLSLVKLPLVRKSISRRPKAWRSFALAVDRLHALFRGHEGTIGMRIWEALLCGYKTTASHFCSELVVYLYEALGLDMVLDGEAKSFSPDDLRSPDRSLLQELGGVLVTPSERHPIPFDSHDPEGRVVEALIAEVNVTLKAAEATFRDTFSREDLRVYLNAAVALEKGRRPSRMTLELEASIDALLEDGYRMVEMVLNLEDLRKTLQSPSAGQSRDKLRQWCVGVSDRLKRDLPLRPAKAAIVRNAMAHLTEEKRGRYPAAERVYQKHVQMFTRISELHGLAQRLTDRLLTEATIPEERPA